MKKHIANFLLYLLKKVQTDKKNNDSNVDDNKRYSKVSVKNIIIKQNINIPKNVFYFYVENECPSYLKYSIKSIKEHLSKCSVDIVGFNYDTFFKKNEIWNIIVKEKMDKIENFTLQQIYSVLYKYKKQFLCKYGGVYCSPSFYCIRNFDVLLSNNCFNLMGIKNGNVFVDDCMYGVKKGCVDDPVKIYPPVNYDVRSYQTLKFTFRNGNLNNIKTNCNIMQSYGYNFI